MRAGARWRLTGGLACVLMTATACSQFGTDGLQLRADDSIEIVVPQDRAEVGVPIEVSWTDAAPREGGAYLVLVDRSPMPPGEDVTWFARDDDSCVVSQGCPDDLWLARRGITVTGDRSVTIEIVPPRGESRADAPYDLTIVRLDANGARDGESAFSVQFRLEDDG